MRKHLDYSYILLKQNVKTKLQYDLLWGLNCWLHDESYTFFFIYISNIYTFFKLMNYEKDICEIINFNNKNNLIPYIQLYFYLNQNQQWLSSSGSHH
jgi:hypothetical protein